MTDEQKVSAVESWFNRARFDRTTCKTLQDYCTKVAERFEKTYGETIEPTPVAIYDAMKAKGLI